MEGFVLVGRFCVRLFLGWIFFLLSLSLLLLLNTVLPYLLLFLMGFLGTACGTWDFYGGSMGFLWGFHGISMTFLGNFYAISVVASYFMAFQGKKKCEVSMIC